MAASRPHLRWQSSILQLPGAQRMSFAKFVCALLRPEHDSFNQRLEAIAYPVLNRHYSSTTTIKRPSQKPVPELKKAPLKKAPPRKKTTFEHQKPIKPVCRAPEKGKHTQIFHPLTNESTTFHPRPLYYSEATAAVYCGYTCQSHFRQLLVSTPVLSAFTILRQHVRLDSKHKISSSLVLGMIKQALFNERNGGPKIFGTSINHLVELYLTTQRTKWDSHTLFSGIIYHTTALLTFPQSQPHPQTITAFETLTAVRIPPPLNNNNLRALNRPPKLGPHTKLGECELEKYNRVYCIFKHLYHHLSRKETGLFGAAEPYKEVLLYPRFEQFPWMESMLWGEAEGGIFGVVERVVGRPRKVGESC